MDTKNIDTISALISTGTKVEGKNVLPGVKLVGTKMKSDEDIEFEKKILGIKDSLLELEKTCPFLMYRGFCEICDGTIESGYFIMGFFDVNVMPEYINEIIEQCNGLFLTSHNILEARKFGVHAFCVDFGFGHITECVSIDDDGMHPILLLTKIDKNNILTDEKALELKEALVKLEKNYPTVSYDGYCDYIFDVNAAQDMEINKIINQCAELFMVNKRPVYHNIIKAMNLGLQVFAGKYDKFTWVTACVRLVGNNRPGLEFMQLYEV